MYMFNDKTKEDETLYGDAMCSVRYNKASFSKILNLSWFLDGSNPTV